MDLNAVRIFVKVVESGSFVQAARLMGIPVSTVSYKVSSLEKALGTTLLRRTTRRLHLTEAGETYFERCQKSLGELSQAEAAIRSIQNEPQGVLRITAPVDLGSACLLPWISQFSKKFPKVQLEFYFSNEVIDLIQRGLDLAIRAGTLADSSLVSRKLGVSTWALYAAPSYIRKIKTLSHPKDLAACTGIGFTGFNSGDWELVKGATRVKVRIKIAYAGSDIGFTKALCLAGKGVTFLPDFSCRKEVDSGKLARVFPEWIFKTEPIHIVYPRQSFIDSKIRAFTDTAVDEFRTIFNK